MRFVLIYCKNQQQKFLVTSILEKTTSESTEFYVLHAVISLRL
jgi:hypothetical protein